MLNTSTTGSHSIDFYQVYAQNTSANNDKLEVVYSSDCRAHWTALWNAAGSSLATTSPTTTYWLPSPSPGSSDWKMRSVNLTSVPASGIVAFRATADGGNNLLLDDINIYAGVGVSNVLNAGSLSLFPNPVRKSDTGRTVKTVLNETMAAGKHQQSISTQDLAGGLYSMVVRTEDGSATLRLSVIK